ncbi:hypothetical protein COX84_02640, partial [Candidatus Micrarchaeota archaeon CG_4_10_14_0_2_um_filter_49_7]
IDTALLDTARRLVGELVSWDENTILNLQRTLDAKIQQYKGKDEALYIFYTDLKTTMGQQGITKFSEAISRITNALRALFDSYKPGQLEAPDTPEILANRKALLNKLTSNYKFLSYGFDIGTIDIQVDRIRKLLGLSPAQIMQELSKDAKFSGVDAAAIMPYIRMLQSDPSSIDRIISDYLNSLGTYMEGLANPDLITDRRAFQLLEGRITAMKTLSFLVTGLDEQAGGALKANLSGASSVFEAGMDSLQEAFRNAALTDYQNMDAALRMHQRGLIILGWIGEESKGKKLSPEVPGIWKGFETRVADCLGADMARLLDSASIAFLADGARRAEGFKSLLGASSDILKSIIEDYVIGDMTKFEINF